MIKLLNRFFADRRPAGRGCNSALLADDAPWATPSLESLSPRAACPACKDAGQTCLACILDIWEKRDESGWMPNRAAGGANTMALAA